MFRFRKAAVGATLAVSGLVLAVVPSSAPAAGPTTEVTFVSLPVAKAVLTNGSVAANATTSVVVHGGSTTVPTSATVVQLDVTVKGTKDGHIDVFPMANPTGMTDTISWAAGTTSHAVIKQAVGLSDKVSIHNLSLAGATVTVKILGYSNQVTAAGINGSGGQPGQVLTNTGAGAAWQPASLGVAARAGVVSVPLNQQVVVATAQVPAGSYWAMFTADQYSTGSQANVVCYLRAPGGQIIDYTYNSTSAGNTDVSVATQGLFATQAGGQVAVLCNASGTAVGLYSPSLTLVSVGSTAGNPVISARRTAKTSALPAHH